MNWQKMFAPWILERGRDYWNDGCTEILCRDGNTVTAVVSGTEDYDVEIEVSRGGNIAYMSCTCPYAEDGSHCKHMAAVLFAMDKNPPKKFDIQRDGEASPKLPWQETLNLLSPEEMRQLLSELAQSDRGLQEQIITLHGQLAPEQHGKRNLPRFRKNTQIAMIISATIKRMTISWNWSIFWRHVCRSCWQRIGSRRRSAFPAWCLRPAWNRTQMIRTEAAVFLPAPVKRHGGYF